MRLTPAVKTAAALVATAVLGVSAASAFVAASPPAPTPQSPIARAGSERIEQTTRDPELGLAWAVRSYISTSGGTCVEAGRLKNGRFGQIDAGQAFREAPVEEAGTCADLREEPVVLAINHYPAIGQSTPRTVLFGQARADVAEVAVTGPDGVKRRLVKGAGGGFVLSFAGALQPADLPVQITLLAGQRQTFDWR
ncbi:MAG TPA: hypothetical protein VEX67_05595 [Solirubrobacteraceae bacterium]|nr:hypothetical protein [Solirubrobacteraceae bacterium]